MHDALASGYTVADVARRYRVGADKVRSWIRAGELAGINTADALCAKPRYVVTPDSLAAFERRRNAGPPPKTPRRQRKAEMIDYYPD